jgi:glycolate oxidase
MTSIVDLLTAELGARVSVDPAVLDVARADRSGRVSASRPLAVVVATTIDDVQTTLRLANEHGIPVVPRGAGTGLAGGAIGEGGEIVLRVDRMNRVLEINEEDALAVVEPGILNDDLNAMLEPHGLWFTPDPASKAISTVGGNIATNAGGLLCAKYGVTRDSVLALKVVLADGRLLALGHRSVKGVTGFDLTSLFVGSEGTLGVIVEATVKLVPLPTGPKLTIGAYFATLEAAAGASAAITAARLRPAVMEIIGESALAAITRYLGESTDGPGSYLLVQFESDSGDADAAKALALVAAEGGRADLSTDAAEGERLFAVRRAFHPAMAALGTVLIEDVAVPRSALPAMFAAIREVEERYGITVPTVAHAGDGNLHPNFVFNGVEVPDEIWRAADEIFQACLRLGGTLTGEHGVGILKRRWLVDELGEHQLDLQRQIKRVFDPRGILNPGKVF